MIDVNTAGKLLDFGTRLDSKARADEQLAGAVAIHNLLERQGVAYLADEVGMGKTYVALGALALFRHYNPSFRVLVVTPRSNIQSKWMKEQRNFVANNVRFSDMRNRSLQGNPVRPLVSCGNLLEMVREVATDPDRDFFAKMTSFQFPMANDSSVNKQRSERIRQLMLKSIPWLPRDIFDLRSKDKFKDNFAMALCCVLPRFDLVIVDEAHNLKHGFGENVASRNRLLGLAMGHPSTAVDERLFPGFAPRAQRVLFLSATPVEESYRQLWNQLDVFGKADGFDELLDQESDEHDKKKVAARFLIRRVTSVRMGASQFTKNEYRREWRRGGVAEHDNPIRVEDPKQRMIVALVQKKVSELLGHAQFNSTFQIGMLASFESFLETAKLKKDENDVANFDDSSQTDNAAEKEGIDVGDINRLAKSYRDAFSRELPHPKMDALIESLSRCWETGEKALVFVRRVASVKELKRKLDDRYNDWLKNRLLTELPTRLHDDLNKLFEDYRIEQTNARNRHLDVQDSPSEGGQRELDVGGSDTFFAWFFRGEGPKNVISGATVQRRFIQRGTVLATFFSDNYVADVLRCQPASTEECLAKAIDVGRQELLDALRERAKRFLSGAAKRLTRGDRFEAVQAAAIEILKEHPYEFQEQARIVWHEVFEHRIHSKPTQESPLVGGLLNVETFFTRLRDRPELKQALWPDSLESNPVLAFREREWRASLLASAARLGHAFIDFYVLAASRLQTLEQRASTEDDAGGEDMIAAYLNLLERQRTSDPIQRGWRAFDELSEIATHFQLVIDVNAPDVRRQVLDEVASGFGTLLGRQQPVAGMSGKVNDTVVRQFRMPGYPLVLFTTDLLQEGEDLHTFCSSIHHYGISWTPSAMEQRIGRIDRVRSHSDRRLSALANKSTGSEELIAGDGLAGDAKLQVFFPHLEDTVEVFQVHRVLQRMNVFLRLMHEGLTTPTSDGKTINANHEFVKAIKPPEQIRGHLKTAFPILAEHLVGDGSGLAVTPDQAIHAEARFAEYGLDGLPSVDCQWERATISGVISGTVTLTNRIQPFTLILNSVGQFPAVRCISPIGLVDPSNELQTVLDASSGRRMKLGAIVTNDGRSYDLTIEGDVLLTTDEVVNRKRVADLVQRVVNDADYLEQKLLPGKDEPLESFRDDLNREVSGDD